MKPSQQLSAAKALITLPEHWTQNAFARNGVRTIGPLEDGATCWCSLGAVLKATSVGTNNGDIGRESIGAAEYYLQSAAYDLVAHFNDTHEHHEVLSVFEMAIILAKADEAKGAV